MRSFLIGALTASLVLPHAAVAQSYDAAALLALHHKFVGWQFGDGTFNSLVETGSLSNAYEQRSYGVTDITMGAIYRDVTVDPDTGEPFEDGFTGRVFWETDENGFTRPDYSPRQALDVSESVLFNEGTSELTGTLERTGVLNGISYPTVRVQPPNGDAIDLYVDPTSGAYVRAVLDPGGPYETTIDILSYADALPGKKVIAKYRDDQWTFAVTKFQPNVALSPSDLHPPPQRATWDFANPNTFPILVKPHAIFIDASIDGVRGRFLLDTGASSIYVNNAFADRAHLATISTGTASGIGPNQVHLRVRRASSLTIGGNTLHNVLIDTAHFEWNEDNEQPDGLIGYPLFAGAIVNLNTSNQTMQILDPSVNSADTSHGLPIRVDLRDGLPVVPMTIDNKVTANALLDTGDGGFVALSQELVSKRGIPIMAHAYTGNAFYHPEDPSSIGDYINSHAIVCGVGGCEAEACSTVSSISIGPIVYQSTYACVSPSITSDNLIVGYDFLRNFDFVFDYRDGILVLKPHMQ